MEYHRRDYRRTWSVSTDITQGTNNPLGIFYLNAQKEYIVMLVAFRKLERTVEPYQKTHALVQSKSGDLLVINCVTGDEANKYFEQFRNCAQGDDAEADRLLSLLTETGGKFEKGLRMRRVDLSNKDAPEKVTEGSAAGAAEVPPNEE